jgi:hypothetical protein
MNTKHPDNWNLLYWYLEESKAEGREIAAEKEIVKSESRLTDNRNRQTKRPKAFRKPLLPRRRGFR